MDNTCVCDITPLEGYLIIGGGQTGGILIDSENEEAAELLYHNSHL